MDEHNEWGLCAQMYKELAQHVVAPTRKAMEVTGEDGVPSKGTFMLPAFLEQHNDKTVGPPFEQVGGDKDMVTE